MDRNLRDIVELNKRKNILECNRIFEDLKYDLVSDFDKSLIGLSDEINDELFQPYHINTYEHGNLYDTIYNMDLKFDIRIRIKKMLDKIQDEILTIMDVYYNGVYGNINNDFDFDRLEKDTDKYKSFLIDTSLKSPNFFCDLDTYYITRKLSYRYEFEENDNLYDDIIMYLKRYELNFEESINEKIQETIRKFELLFGLNYDDMSNEIQKYIEQNKTNEEREEIDEEVVKEVIRRDLKNKKNKGKITFAEKQSIQNILIDWGCDSVEMILFFEQELKRNNIEEIVPKKLPSEEDAKEFIMAALQFLKAQGKMTQEEKRFILKTLVEWNQYNSEILLFFEQELKRNGFDKDGNVIQQQIIEEQKIEKYNEIKNKDINQENIDSFCSEINPVILNSMFKLPDGTEIKYEQYLKEIIFPQLPSNGVVILNDNKFVNVNQFVEEFLTYDCQKNYNGDFYKYIYENTRKNVGAVSFDNGRVCSPEIVAQYVNPLLLEKNINIKGIGIISAKEYIEKYYSPHIPSNGKVILKNGEEISVIDFIENYLLSDDLSNYNGNIEQYLYDMTRNNNGKVDTKNYNKNKEKYLENIKAIEEYENFKISR